MNTDNSNAVPSVECREAFEKTHGPRPKYDTFDQDQWDYGYECFQEGWNRRTEPQELAKVSDRSPAEVKNDAQVKCPRCGDVLLESNWQSHPCSEKTGPAEVSSEPEWMTRLRNELFLSAAKSNFTLSRDELLYILDRLRQAAIQQEVSNKTSMVEGEREAFEEYASRNGLDLNRMGGGEDYRHIDTWKAWRAWRAGSLNQHSTTGSAAVKEGEAVFEVGFGWLKTETHYPKGTLLYTAPLSTQPVLTASQVDELSPGEVCDQCGFIKTTAQELVDFGRCMAAHPVQGVDEQQAKDAALMDALEEFENRLSQWAQAYPTDIFKVPDWNKAHEVLTANGMTLDGISAANMRHVAIKLDELFNPVRAALSTTKQEGKG